MKFITPPDGWGMDHGLPRTPRAWQVEALPVVINHFSQPNPLRAMIQAVMASGKSVFIAQLLASIELDRNEVIVVSTSTIKLVKQLSATFRERLESMRSMRMRWRVGSYFTHGKDINSPLIVTCTPSMPDLSKILESHGRRCVFWIPDEAHKTAAETIQVAYDYLKPERVCGFSATPFLSDEKKSLSLFDRLIYAYAAKDALRDGVVVPWRIVPWEGGEEELDKACIKMTANAVGPGMYNATSIADAEVFVEKLRDAGVEAMSVHSRMKDEESDRRIAMLRDGHIAAIVHVAMLTEGVDLPWLRWLCLRRPVSSRVRFCQEVGRVLRSYVDQQTGEVKTEAVLYDPHDLFGEMRLTYEAVLGGEYLIDNTPEVDESERAERAMEQQAFEIMRNLVEAKAGKSPLSMDPLAAYLREVVTAFDVCGLIERKIVNREWRHMGVSANQELYIKSLNGRGVTTRPTVPKTHQRILGVLCGIGKQMTRGMASDLISILVALSDKKKWPDFKQLDRSADENTKKHEDRRMKNPDPTPEPARPAVKKKEPELHNFPLGQFSQPDHEEHEVEI